MADSSGFAVYTVFYLLSDHRCVLFASANLAASIKPPNLIWAFWLKWCFLINSLYSCFFPLFKKWNRSLHFYHLLTALPANWKCGRWLVVRCWARLYIIKRCVEPAYIQRLVLRLFINYRTRYFSKVCTLYYRKWLVFSTSDASAAHNLNLIEIYNSLVQQLHFLRNIHL